MEAVGFVEPRSACLVCSARIRTSETNRLETLKEMTRQYLKLVVSVVRPSSRAWELPATSRLLVPNPATNLARLSRLATSHPKDREIH